MLLLFLVGVAIEDEIFVPYGNVGEGMAFLPNDIASLEGIAVVNDQIARIPDVAVVYDR